MYSLKQQELLSTLTACCDQNGIFLRGTIDGCGVPRLVSVDVEHDEQGHLVGIGVYSDLKEHLWYTQIMPFLKDILENSRLIAHNGISDLNLLREWGIDVKNNQLVWDTELFAHILDSSRSSYGLKKLATDDLGLVYPSYDDIVGKRTAKQSKERITLDKQPQELVEKYNALDCYATYKLYEYQKRQVNEKIYKYFTEIERPIAEIFDAMSTRGIRVDLAYLRDLKSNLEAQKKPIEEAIKNELGPINLNSPPQLLKALQLKGFNPQNKKGPSTDKEALSKLEQTLLIKQLQERNELETLLSTFCNKYLERGEEIVHPFFNQCGTRTGRPSCSNPNLLQIPRKTENGKRVRRMFIPRKGFRLGDCDYGQIEPRIMAHLSQDSILCKMFNDGVDFHTFTAERLGIDRERAKVLNLSVGYRATFKSVMSQLRCSKDEAQRQIEAWWSLFPQLRRWQDTLIYNSRRSGFVTTLLGRRIQVDGLRDGNSWKREHAERQLINNLIQGSAAEVMKMGMLKVRQDKRLHPQFGLLIQVYDQLVAESPNMEQDLQYMKEDMEEAIKLSIPLVCEAKIGPNWAEVK